MHRRARVRIDQCLLWVKSGHLAHALIALDVEEVWATAAVGMPVMLKQTQTREVDSLVLTTLEIISGLPFHVVPGVVHVSQSGWRRRLQSA